MIEMESSEPQKNEAEQGASPVATYKVGYCCPPVHTRFQKNKSGNPDGRRKGSRNIRTILAATCNEKINATENGRLKKITKLEAAIKHVVNRAAAGDQKAFQLLLRMHASMNAEALPEEPDRSDEADDAIMASLARRFGRDDGGLLQ